MSETTVCPECGDADIYVAGRRSGRADSADHRWGCSDCGATFDEAATRERKGRDPRSGLAKTLAEADPEVIG